MSARTASSDVLASSSAAQQIQVIWCHERCYKKELEDVRSAVTEATDGAGFNLTCFKKAPTFVAWAKRNPPPPYVLLTDNREFKPCFTYLEQADASVQSLLIVAMVPDGKQRTKMLKHLHRAPRSQIHSPVCIVQSELELAEIFQKVSRGEPVPLASEQFEGDTASGCQTDAPSLSSCSAAADDGLFGQRHNVHSTSDSHCSSSGEVVCCPPVSNSYCNCSILDTSAFSCSAPAGIGVSADVTSYTSSSFVTSSASAVHDYVQTPWASFMVFGADARPVQNIFTQASAPVDLSRTSSSSSCDERSLLATSAVSWAPAVAATFAAALPTETPFEVTLLLEAAKPCVYED